MLVTLVTYLLRSPVSALSPALYSPEDPDSVVMGIEAALGDSPCSDACVLDVGHSRTLMTKQPLQYDELLTEVMKYEKVIVL